MNEESALADLQELFPEPLRTKGRELVRSGSVVVSQLDARQLEVEVLDRPTARTSLRQDVNSLSVTCSCPDFKGANRCAHVWATLLTAVEKEYLSGVLKRGPRAPSRPGQGEGIPWKQVLQSLRFQEGPTPKPRRDTEIIYRANLGDARVTGRFVVHVCTRTRLRNGQWGTPRPATVTRQAASRFPDPQDRRIFGMVLGAQTPETSYGYYNGFGYFQPGEHQSESLISELCRTGRFFLGDPEEQAVQSAPCVWDENGPWTVRLLLESAKGGDGYALWGRLERGDESMDLSEPHLFVLENVVFARGKAGTFRTAAHSSWIPLLRRTGPAVVPRNEVGRFLQELCSSPGRAAGIEIHESVRPKVIAGPARPRLRLSVPKGGDGVRLAAQVSFDYGDVRIESSDPRDTVYRPEGNALVSRDRAGEADALSVLAELRFRKPSYRLAGTPADFELDGKKLPRVVPFLIERGWSVEGDGGVFRAPGRFRISVSSGIDWFDLEGGVEYGDDTVIPFPRLLAALKAGEKFIRLDDGTMGLLPEEWLKRRGLVLEAGRSSGGALRYRPSQALLLGALLESEKGARADETFERLRNRLHRFEGIEPGRAPEGFRGTLRPYQELGLGWLQFLESSGLGGCLADDMGLGKTVQVLAWLESRRARRKGPTLVVVPRSLLFNWKAESARFTPALRVVEHVGQGRAQDGAGLADADLVLTTYGTLRRDAPVLKDVAFDVAILDEAQAVKNATSATAQAARLIRAGHRLALSGTPIENHLGELWSLLEFLNPGMLGKIAAFRRVLEEGSDPDDSMRALLARALRPILLRRTKKEVAPELPERTEQTLWVELEAAERKRYDELKQHYRHALLERTSAAEFDRKKMHVLEALLRLRQAACHPGLLDPEQRGVSSSKLDTLLEQVKEVLEEGHKALVFSQFTSLLGIVRERLGREAIPHEYLDGKTRDRAERVKRFQEDATCPLFLISLKAGGVGLNLTAAEYVFLLDPWWNPAVEAQAIDRTHRIGQSRAVFAYRLVARDTVEEKVLELQKSKRALADAILGADKSLMADLTREDLQLLLS